MNEYTKIERELRSLGYEKEHRSGDHVMFRKDDKTIILSMGLDAAAHSLKNSIQQIRRVEPLFMPRIKRTRTESEDRESGDNGLPHWMQPGRSVRYGSPERHDYSRLEDPESVMNVEYVVESVGEADPATGLRPLTIRPKNAPGTTFTVFPEELDAWETAPCADCLSDIPINALGTDENGDNICAACAEFREYEKNEERRNTPDGEGTHYDADETETSLYDIACEDIDKIIRENIGNNLISMVPEEDKRDIFSALGRISDALEKEDVRNLRKKYKWLFDAWETWKTGPKKPTPLQAWKESIELMLFIHTMDNKGFRAPDPHDPETKALQQRFAKGEIGYSIKQRRMKNGLLPGPVQVFTINTSDPQDTILVLRASQDIIGNLSKAYPENNTVILLLKNSREDFNQYIVRATKENDVLKTLLPDYTSKKEDYARVFGEQDPSMFAFMELEEMSGIDTTETEKKFTSALVDYATEKFGIPRKTADEVMLDQVSSTTSANIDGIVSDEAMMFNKNIPAPYVQINIDITKAVCKDLILRALRGLLDERPEAILPDDPFVVNCIDTDRENPNSFKRRFNFPGKKETPEQGDEGERPLLVIRTNAGEGSGLTFEGTLTEEDAVRILNACSEASTRDKTAGTVEETLGRVLNGHWFVNLEEPAPRRLRFGSGDGLPAGNIEFDDIDEFPDIKALPPEENDNKTVTDMNNDNKSCADPLDATNPASGNAAVAGLTTRELLRELKDRGVTFEGLEVPVIVRRSISLDEI